MMLLDVVHSFRKESVRHRDIFLSSSETTLIYRAYLAFILYQLSYQFNPVVTFCDDLVNWLRTYILLLLHILHIFFKSIEGNENNRYIVKGARPC